MPKKKKEELIQITNEQKKLIKELGGTLTVDSKKIPEELSVLNKFGVDFE